MARYLRSQTTGVVLPYNEKLLQRPNMELMSEDECTKYEAGLQDHLATKVIYEVTTPPPPTPAPTPKPKPKPKAKAKPEPESEITTEELLGALETD